MKLPKGVPLASHRHRRSLASPVNRDGQISVMIALWPKECGYGCKDFLVQLGGRVAELHQHGSLNAGVIGLIGVFITEGRLVSRVNSTRIAAHVQSRFARAGSHGYNEAGGIESREVPGRPQTQRIVVDQD